MFMSRLEGTDAFSAVNIVYPLLSFVIALGTMFGTGITAIVSRKLGEGKQQEANENVTFITFAVGLGIVITILSFVFLEKIIYMLGANEDIYAYCYAYAFLYLSSSGQYSAVGIPKPLCGERKAPHWTYRHSGRRAGQCDTGLCIHRCIPYGDCNCQQWLLSIGYCIPAFFSIFTLP